MIFVNGQNIRRETNKVQRSIGYCPQTDTVITHFTGRENLVYFLILRGYSKNSAEILAEAIARKHGFYSHIDKRVNVYSGGNKRKLCLAIALLGDAPILALDEPTSGVDPGSRRYMFSLITEASRGKTTLLTTHHLEDCEAICTRALIMANGKFKCIGSLQHLKTKFAAGYFIIIKLEANKQGNPPTDTQLKSLKDYMFENFADPPLVEELLFSLTYRVSNKDTPWSKAFSVMENAEKSFPIEDISIEQCGLDEICSWRNEEKVF
ncbi:ATP-binding cassette sub-family A member 3-like isoform X2 [Agrilus planipennis]|uniref:ATP-binding cassette sub-family A member 3-like isoform X2 n=1 Tax=Agrilus planipennis TaxID=224129 RepID=A0A1W4XMF4_AGRPL|nr:ATP-binding cassette sub-family A member 3-like isoform X2 [Agrilus planipennis]